MRHAFAQWPGLRAAIWQQLSARRQKLYPSLPKDRDVAAAQQLASDQAFRHLHRFVNQETQHGDADAAGAYPDIALPHSVFLRHLLAAHRIMLARRLGRPARFLDVGCGAGMQLLIAAQFFRPSDGFDFDPGYVAAAEKLVATVDLAEVEIFEQDALTFDGYAAYDVIYFYQPMHDEVKLHQLEERIVSQAPPGTLLIAPYVSFEHRYDALGCSRVAGRCYLAHTKARAAARVRRRAELMGPNTTLSPRRTVEIWDPVVIRLRANGYFSGDAFSYQPRSVI